MKIRELLLKALALCFLTSAITIHAHEDIDALKTKIIAILKQSNPKTVSTFSDFFKQYDRVVIHFFDRSNNDSLATHIAFMEKELKQLDTVAKDKQYAPIKTMLTDLYGNLRDLVDTLRGYVDTSNSVFLALSVRKFKFLLPTEIQEKGEFSLFKSLRHRHNC